MTPCVWVRISQKPAVWRCSNWPRRKEMRFGATGFSRWTGKTDG